MSGRQNSFDRVAQLALAATLMGQRQEFDGDLAGDLLGQLGDQRFEGAPVGRAREELVAIDEVQECQGLSTQRVDDMAVVDHLVVPPVRMGPSLGSVMTSVPPMKISSRSS